MSFLFSYLILKKFVMPNNIQITWICNIAFHWGGVIFYSNFSELFLQKITSLSPVELSFPSPPEERVQEKIHLPVTISAKLKTYQYWDQNGWNF